MFPLKWLSTYRHPPPTHTQTLYTFEMLQQIYSNKEREKRENGEEEDPKKKMKPNLADLQRERQSK